MPDITKQEYAEIIKSERNKHFITPFDLVYKAFVDLKFDQKDAGFFRKHASEYVEQMRTQCWYEYVPFEEEFTTRLLNRLITYSNYEEMSATEAIQKFVSKYPQHIYALSLSNTQSRRSRAGKEFEAIIEMLLIGADISTDSQGNVGKQTFAKNGLGKLVDFVSPGVVEYIINKRNTTLISAKTTLRERWQEVPEEVSRTGIREMYLATLDDSITKETLRVLYEANIIIATTKSNKEAHYSEEGTRVITFEELLDIITESFEKWDTYRYSDKDIETMKKFLSKQVKRHSEHPYAQTFYQKRLEQLPDTQ